MAALLDTQISLGHTQLVVVEAGEAGRSGPGCSLTGSFLLNINGTKASVTQSRATRNEDGAELGRLPEGGLMYRATFIIHASKRTKIPRERNRDSPFF